MNIKQSNLKMKSDKHKILTCLESNAEYLLTQTATLTITNTAIVWLVEMHKNQIVLIARDKQISARDAWLRVNHVLVREFAVV